MNKRFNIANLLSSVACISLLSVVAACANPDGGYYDANGNYIATDTPHNMQDSTSIHSPLPGGTTEYDDYHYTRRGYYDYNGDYVPNDSGLAVPQEMFPPRGMCRVWFTNRSAAQQPPVESCDGIRSRVPAGAYVIYGG